MCPDQVIKLLNKLMVQDGVMKYPCLVKDKQRNIVTSNNCDKIKANTSKVKMIDKISRNALEYPGNKAKAMLVNKINKNKVG